MNIILTKFFNIKFCLITNQGPGTAGRRVAERLLLATPARFLLQLEKFKRCFFLKSTVFQHFAAKRGEISSSHVFQNQRVVADRVLRVREYEVVEELHDVRMV